MISLPTSLEKTMAAAKASATKDASATPAPEATDAPVETTPTTQTETTQEAEANKQDEFTEVVSASAAPLILPGSLVHYVMPAGHRRSGEVRPAMVIRIWANQNVNLQVFLDGANDDDPNFTWNYRGWVGTVAYDPEGTPGTWNFPS